ncbi:PH domain-containing protein [Glycomyces buryatensis]|uniref:PH domain-containing protein n=1 Tax=Glycomyces buryatensis TaxID=2570927 RepID=A0A4S8QRY0_9ACTN|nr:PH domain-containing protein [Glycomyces buryatensis]THV43394.1 PH domain-containing protein [Glycomyces buryatensis]
MSFPEDVLAPNEAVRIHLQPHRIGLITVGVRFTILCVIALLLITNFERVAGQTGDLELLLFLVAVLVAAGFAIREFARLVGALLRLWFTHYLVTTDRVVWHYGFLGVRGSDMPLRHVSSISYRQTLFGRLLNYGELRIEASIDTAAILFRDVQNVRQIRTEIYRLIQERTRQADGDQTAPEHS